MSYITSETVVNALKRMKIFHKFQVDLHDEFGMDFQENLGRRNIIMSAAQEHFFAAEIAKAYPGAISDGGTGRADIIIPSLDKELECKITSRTKAGAFSLQTDYETLKKKGKLDYLYVLASEDFQKFAVIFFENLTVEDFHPVSPGSRGKVKMNKTVAIQKSTILHGNIIDRNEIELRKLSMHFFNTSSKAFTDVTSGTKKIWSCSNNAIKKRARLKNTLENKMARHSTKMKKLIEKTKYWENAPKKYSFELYEV